MNIHPITPAHLADLPRLAEMLTGPGGTQAAISTALRGLHYALENPQYGGVWVLRNGETLLGLVSLFETVSTAEGGAVGLLQDLVVAPESRGLGYGKILLRHAISEAGTRGYLRVTLMAGALSPETRRFFQNHGFADSGMISLRQAFPPASATGPS